MNKEKNVTLKLKLNKWVPFESLKVVCPNFILAVSTWLNFCLRCSEEEMANDQLSGVVSHFAIC